jgi:hypothetical protein
MRPRGAAPLLAAALLALSLAGARPALAAGFAVTRTDDPAPNGCLPGDCSLREAVIAANASPGPDTIAVPSGTFALSIAGANEDAAATGDLDLTGDVTVTGAGSGVTTVDAGGLDRAFDVPSGAGLTIAVSGLTVRNGSASDGGGIANRGATVSLTDVSVCDNTAVNTGGGILNRDGSLTLDHAQVCDNQSTADNDNGRGGGIANHAISGNATLVLSGTAVSGNTVAGLGGGGIDNAPGTGRTASVTLDHSSLVGNVATGIDHTEGLGGGVQNSFFRAVSGASALLSVTDSTIAGNLAVNGAGVSSGIDFAGNVLDLTVVRSTVSGNISAGNEFQVGNGAGIYVVNGTASITNSTVAGNTADGTGQLSGLGGGVFNSGLSGPSSVTLLNTTVADNTANAGGGGVENVQVNGATSMTLQNTIVSDNTAPGGAGCQNVSGTLTSDGHNLEDHDTCHFAAAGDLPNTDPDLGPLIDHRGPTLTMAIPDASPAAEAGDVAACPPTDQRGTARNQVPGCSIGSYERSLATATISLTSVPKSPQDVSFLGDLGSFVLDDDGNPLLPNSVTATDLPPATYQVSEQVPAGWTGDVSGCGPGGSTATIVIVGADAASCGFTNTKTPAPTCGGVAATFVGTEGDDVLPGGIVSALGGNDRVQGRTVADRLCGDDGNDLVAGGAGNDVLIGGAGDDTLAGGPGFDVCIGGPGVDSAVACEMISGIP